MPPPPTHCTKVSLNGTTLNAQDEGVNGKIPHTDAHETVDKSAEVDNQPESSNTGSTNGLCHCLMPDPDLCFVDENGKKGILRCKPGKVNGVKTPNDPSTVDEAPETLAQRVQVSEAVNKAPESAKGPNTANGEYLQPRIGRLSRTQARLLMEATEKAGEFGTFQTPWLKDEVPEPGKPPDLRNGEYLQPRIGRLSRTQARLLMEATEKAGEFGSFTTPWLKAEAPESVKNKAPNTPNDDILQHRIGCLSKAESKVFKEVIDKADAAASEVAPVAEGMSQLTNTKAPESVKASSNSPSAVSGYFSEEPSKAVKQTLDKYSLTSSKRLSGTKGRILLVSTKSPPSKLWSRASPPPVSTKPAYNKLLGGHSASHEYRALAMVSKSSDGGSVKATSGERLPTGVPGNSFADPSKGDDMETLACSLFQGREKIPNTPNQSPANRNAEVAWKDFLKDDSVPEMGPLDATSYSGSPEGEDIEALVRRMLQGQRPIFNTPKHEALSPTSNTEKAWEDYLKDDSVPEMDPLDAASRSKSPYPSPNRDQVPSVNLPEATLYRIFNSDITRSIPKSSVPKSNAAAHRPTPNSPVKTAALWSSRIEDNLSPDPKTSGPDGNASVSKSSGLVMSPQKFESWFPAPIYPHPDDIEASRNARAANFEKEFYRFIRKTPPPSDSEFESEYPHRRISKAPVAPDTGSETAFTTLQKSGDRRSRLNLVAGLLLDESSDAEFEFDFPHRGVPKATVAPPAESETAYTRRQKHLDRCNLRKLMTKLVLEESSDSESEFNFPHRRIRKAPASKLNFPVSADAIIRPKPPHLQPTVVYGPAPKPSETKASDSKAPVFYGSAPKPSEPDDPEIKASISEAPVSQGRSPRKTAESTYPLSEFMRDRGWTPDIQPPRNYLPVAGWRNVLPNAVPNLEAALASDSTPNASDVKASLPKATEIASSDSDSIVEPAMGAVEWLQSVQVRKLYELDPTIFNEAVAEFEGKTLVRLSTFVPHLFGATSYLPGQRMIRATQIKNPFFLSLLDLLVIPMSEIPLQDQTLMWILFEIKVCDDTHKQSSREVLKYFNIKGPKLHVWIAGAEHTYTEKYIGLEEFLVLFKEGYMREKAKIEQAPDTLYDLLCSRKGMTKEKLSQLEVPRQVQDVKTDYWDKMAETFEKLLFEPAHGYETKITGAAEPENDELELKELELNESQPKESKPEESKPKNSELQAAEHWQAGATGLRVRKPIDNTPAYGSDRLLSEIGAEWEKRWFSSRPYRLDEPEPSPEAAELKEPGPKQDVPTEEGVSNEEPVSQENFANGKITLSKKDVSHEQDVAHRSNLLKKNPSMEKDVYEESEILKEDDDELAVTFAKAGKDDKPVCSLGLRQSSSTNGKNEEVMLEAGPSRSSKLKGEKVRRRVGRSRSLNVQDEGVDDDNMVVDILGFLTLVIFCSAAYYSARQLFSML